MRGIKPLLLLLGSSLSLQAHAVGRMAEISIIDRDSGAVLTPYYYRGEYWVAGTPGAHYAIRVQNRRGERLLAITSVDGLNVLTGAPASFDQPGYVFAPQEDYEITGWRKSDDDVAAFIFTDPSSSYAARTGRPANIGVIGVALYRERFSEPPAIGGTVSPPLLPPAPLPPGPVPSPRLGAASPAPSSAGAAGALAQRESAAPEARAKSYASDLSREPLLEAAPTLGTGHGEREYSHVEHTSFVRLQEQPNEIIRIRYDRLERLIAMGIVRRPRPAWPEVNPFPAAPGSGYVPDPPG